MITYKISIQGKKLVPNESPIILGNKFDDNSTRLKFGVSEDIYDGYKYIALQYPDKEKIILVQLDRENNFWVGTSVTSHVGTWQFCLIISTTTIPEDGNVLDSNVIYISDVIKAKVKDNFLDANFDVAENEPNLKIYYNTLNTLTDELRALNAKERIEVLETGLDESNNDISQLQTIVDETTEITTDTAQIAQIYNVIGGLPLDITARVIATQSGSGDPSPTNIRPIVGRDKISLVRCGKNLFNLGYLNPSIGTIRTETGFSVKNLWGNTVVDNKNTIKMLLPDTTYRIRYKFKLNSLTDGTAAYYGTAHGMLRLYSGVNESTFPSIMLGGTVGNYDDAVTWGIGSIREREAVFTTPSDLHNSLANYRIFGYSRRSVDSKGVFVADEACEFYDIQIEYAPEKNLAFSDFEPYNGGTFDIALPKTVYGLESAPVVVDIGRRIIENPTRGIAFDGTENWGFYTGQLTEDFSTYYLNLPTTKLGFQLSTCSHFKNVDNAWVRDKEAYSDHPTVTNKYFVVKNETIGVLSTDSTSIRLSKWKVYLAEQKTTGTPVQVAYQLAEPETLTIDPVVIPSNDGTNIAYTDAGGETTVTGKVGIRASEEIIKKYPFASRYEFYQHGRTITIEPATGSIIKVTPDNNTTITYGTNTYALTANTPFELIAKPGKNIITAASGTLMVEYNRSSMSVLDMLTIVTSNTAPIAQINGVIGDLPLDITARCVATQEGEGDPSPDNKRTIVGVDKISLVRCGKNLLDNKKFIKGSFSGGGYLHIASGSPLINYPHSLTSSYRSIVIAIKCIPGITYTASLPEGIANASIHLTQYRYGATGIGTQDITNGLVIGNYMSLVGSKSSSYTAKDGGNLLLIGLSIGYSFGNEGGTVELTSAPLLQLEVGSTATEYEPYNGGTFDVVLPKTVYGLESAPVLLDVNKGIIENPTLLKVFDGTEAIMANDTTYKAFYYRLQTMKYVNGVITPGIASHFVNASTVTNLLKTPSVVFGKYGNVIYIIFPEPTTVEKVKDLLAEQYAAGTPVQVLYQSLEPEIITINPTVIPSNDGRNTVYTDSGGETTVTGRQSPVAAIEEVKKAIVALGGAINV